jgi:hypothetical protein
MGTGTTIIAPITVGTTTTGITTIVITTGVIIATTANSDGAAQKQRGRLSGGL